MTYSIQAHLMSGGTSGGVLQTHMLVDLQDNSANSSAQMDLDLDSEELAAIPVSSDHDESLPLLPPLPPIPPSLHSLEGLRETIGFQRDSKTIYPDPKHRYLLSKQNHPTQKLQLTLALDGLLSLFEITSSPLSTHLAYGAITRRDLLSIRIRA